MGPNSWSCFARIGPTVPNCLEVCLGKVFVVTGERIPEAKSKLHYLNSAQLSGQVFSSHVPMRPWLFTSSGAGVTLSLEDQGCPWVDP